MIALTRLQNKDIEKDQLTQRFVELKSMISDPDSVYGWADLCRDFDSQFFDLDRRSISLGTHDIKMYGVDFVKRGFTKFDAKLGNCQALAIHRKSKQTTRIITETPKLTRKSKLLAADSKFHHSRAESLHRVR